MKKNRFSECSIDTTTAMIHFIFRRIENEGNGKITAILEVLIVLFQFLNCGLIRYMKSLEATIQYAYYKIVCMINDDAALISLHKTQHQ